MRVKFRRGLQGLLGMREGRIPTEDDFFNNPLAGGAFFFANSKPEKEALDNLDLLSKV